MIKCIYCIGVMLCLNFSTSAQKISNELIASTGDFFSNNRGILEGSLGMLAVNTWESVDGLVFEGFYHPQAPRFTSTQKNSKIGPTISVKTFPNPVLDQVTIQIREAGQYEATLRDASGKMLKVVPFRQHTEIDMAGFPAGTYLISIRDQDWTHDPITIIKL